MKFAVYADLNLNLIDGSAIWLTSITRLLAAIDGAEVSLYLKAPIVNAVNVEALFDLPNVLIIAPAPGADKRALAPQEAVERICADHQSQQFDGVLLRGFEVCLAACARAELANRLWIYSVGSPHAPPQRQSEFNAHTKEMLEAARYVLVQTPQLEAQFRSEFPRVAGKIRLLPPMVPNPPRHRSAQMGQTLRVVYAGQFKQDYAALEMFQVFREIASEYPRVEFHVFGEKIHNPPDSPDFRETVVRELASCPNLRWHRGVGREHVLRQYSAMHVGWAWRTDALERNTLEISTKVLELASYGVPPIVARSPINESLFGPDYPLYANSKSEALTKLRFILDRHYLLPALAEQVRRIATPYQFSQVKTQYLEPLLVELGCSRQGNPGVLGFAGHNLNFVEKLAASFCPRYKVMRHYWCDHRIHDVKASEDLTQQADVIWCEWFMGNAVWHSRHKPQGKKLIVRFHRQELERQYALEADMEQIDTVVFVAEHTRRDAVKKFGWGKYLDRMRVIPNAIDCAYFERVKSKESAFTIGLVGSVPRLKRLDLALDVIERCRKIEPRFKLIVKGRGPSEHLWLQKRPSELAYFETQFERIRKTKILSDGVVFEGWGSNMGEWYRDIGFILSVSDLEGTHQVVAEAGASGAVPLIRNWDGAGEVYDPSWVYSTVDAMAQKLLDYASNRELANDASQQCMHYMKRNFDVPVVRDKCYDLF